MTTRILPQEFHFEDTADSVRVKTVVEKDLIDAAMLIPHARHFRLGAGTIMKVQVMSKDYDVLLYTADFVIERAVDVRKQIIDERGERTATVTDYAVVQDGDWKAYTAAPAEVEPEPKREVEKYVPGEGKIKWNPGKQEYEVIVGGEVLTAVVRNEGEGKDDYKARALSIAAGSEPLTKAA